MATKYLLTTTNTDNSILASQIGDASVTGAKLTSDVNLPVGARLDGVALTDRITAAAGGYDFKESAVTAVFATNTQTIGGSSPYYNDSASAYVSADLPDVPAYGFLIAEATLALNTAIAENQNRALVDNDRVAFSVASGGPSASKRTGIYTVTRGLGKGTTSSAYYYTFTRASDANSTTNFNLGALLYLNAGDLAGRALFLGAGTFNSTTALWTLQESGVYTAGSYISITDGAIAVRATGYLGNNAGDLDLQVAGGSALYNNSGLDVRNADSSYRGTVSSAEWGVVTGSGQYGKNYDISNTAVTRTTDLTSKTFSSPYGTLGANKSALVEVTVVSRSVTVDGSADVTGTCIQKWAFTLARDSSDTAVLDSVQLFKSGTSNILGCTVAMQVTGLSGADAIAVTGVLGSGGSTTIDHNVSIVCRTL